MLANEPTPDATPDTAPRPPVPIEVWQTVFRHLGADDKGVALVSRRFLAAWRAGVVALKIRLADGSALGALLREDFRHYPDLRFARAISADLWGERLLSAPTPARSDPGLALQLELTTHINLRDAVSALRQHPEAAPLVTHISALGSRRLNAEFVDLLPRLPRLVHLDLLFYQDLDDQALIELADLPALRHLGLASCQPFEGAALRHLVGPTRAIGSLELRHSRLQGMHLRHLAGQPGLHRLVLAGCPRLTLDDLDPLADCAQLAQLSLAFNDWVNAQALRRLAQRCPALQALDLSCCDGLDDEAILALAPLASLRRLDLWACDSLSPDGVRALAARLPALTEVMCAPHIAHPPHPPHSTGPEADAPVRNASGQVVSFCVDNRAF